MAQPVRHNVHPLGATLARYQIADACCTPEREQAVPKPAPRPQRGTLADLDLNLHCSIIGTCLTTTELRRLVPRFAPHIDRKRASDLDIHHAAVELTCEGGPARKEINKALDTRHALVIRKFKAAVDEAALRALWQDAMASGEIPGAYWALMTHPCLTPEVRALAFGDVHMLSHLVGASNRADIRRLVALEGECAALRERDERQQARLRDLSVGHAQALRAMEAQVQALSAQCRRPQAHELEDEVVRLRAALAERDAALALHAERHAAAEHKLAASESAAGALRDSLERLQQDLSAARAEAGAAEYALSRLLEVDGGDGSQAALPRLDGACIAYVGGRPGATATLDRLVGAAGGELLLHDGGIEERTGTLAALLSRADMVVFPVDYISHNAMHAIKRLCEQTGVTYYPLRSAGVASFVLLMQRVFGARQVGAAVASAGTARFCLHHG
ncbi:DUF2325 domain-containing protein [Massilia forsythiae]|uniref:DUF2325 domain-containing protein n=1 Tax=Massilia forsythiae TaxID=2728020 RepID=A0A7Z2VT44_9BURK|nr:DUF2325 domain-containing protein [Massilia forsythiae]QJD98980.1 DUF2325 domain-containing protein [Massilia forsythiae]